MKAIVVFVDLLAFPLSCFAENLLTVYYEQSMRIPNNRVVVAIDAPQKLTLRTEFKDGMRKETTLELAPASIEELRRELEKTDWNKARRDKVSGLDGAKVRILYQGREISLWSPDHDTEKRGLETTQSLVRKVFGLAGLDAVGMPAKPKGGKAWREIR